MIPAVAIVGYKNTGKTTLIERLVRECNSRGLRVATLKHDGHDYSFDHPGTDSWRMRQAGAQVVAVVSPQQYVLQDFRPCPPLQSVLERICEVDLILVEGWKKGPLPKLVMLHPQENILQQERLQKICALVTPGNLSYLAPRDIPVYDRDDINGITACLLQVVQAEKEGL